MFKIHFLNVAQGDCTIIRHHSGRLTMIDSNNDTEIDDQTILEFSVFEGEEKRLFRRKSMGSGRVMKSLVRSRITAPITNPVEFLRVNYPGQNLFRYIQSHPNIVNMRGLLELREAGIQILHFWDTEHSIEPEIESESDRMEWAEYQELRSGRCCPVLRLNRGDHDPKSEEDEILVLAPTPDLTHAAHESQNWNNLSYVLKINKRFRFLLPGNAETPVWDDLVTHCKSDLKSVWLKASHQGRDAGFHEESFQAIQPVNTIVSLGIKPIWYSTNKYSQLGESVDSLRDRGTRTYIVDDQFEVTIETERS